MHTPNDIPKCCSIESNAKMLSGGKQSAKISPATPLDIDARTTAVAACSNTLKQRNATYARYDGGKRHSHIGMHAGIR